MMNPPTVVYWDASAVLPVLFADRMTPKAREWAGEDGVHLLSTLALAETVAVIYRLRRERLIGDVLAGAALESLESGPWRSLRLAPHVSDIRGLAGRRSLRGADLWHLAATRTLARELPEVRILTFDRRLQAAADQEGLALPAS